MRSAVDLHAYQVEAAEFAYEHPRCALWMDLGLGKTCVTLTLLARLKREGNMKRALIVAPLRVANQVWHTEILNWKHTRGLTYSVLTGNLRVRLEALKEQTDVHIINRENMAWLVSEFAARQSSGKIKFFRPWPYDVIVIDEATSVKDHSTERFTAFKWVRTLSPRFIELTATPAAEGYMGLFAQFYLLDGGERLGTHITHYREKYFDHNPYAKSWKIKPDADKEIEAKIAGICLVMKAADYLPLRDPLVIDRPVVLAKDEMALYRKLEKEFVLDLPDGAFIEAETAAALASKLLQMSSGSVYDEARQTHFVHDHKVAELQQLVEETQGQPVIVCYWFKSSLARLQKAFPKAVLLDRQAKALDRWNAGKIPMMLVHPQSAGHGLNAQAGGHIMIFFDMPWSLEMYLQVRGRIDRQGQRDVCRFYHLVAEGTADEIVVGALREKRSVQDVFLERVKQLRKGMKHGRQQ